MERRDVLRAVLTLPLAPVVGPALRTLNAAELAAVTCEEKRDPALIVDAYFRATPVLAYLRHRGGVDVEDWV